MADQVAHAGLARLNALSVEECEAALCRVCGSRAWAKAMTASRPFDAPESMHSYANLLWWECTPDDWREAFSHHPRIGSKDALREKFARTAQWAQGEQSRTAEASEATIQGLIDLNDEHDKKYGFIFIICATGKSAEEMLEALRESLKNDPETELRRSATEENKITHLRLDKLLAEVS